MFRSWVLSLIVHLAFFFGIFAAFYQQQTRKAGNSASTASEMKVEVSVQNMPVSGHFKAKNLQAGSRPSLKVDHNEPGSSTKNTESSGENAIFSTYLAQVAAAILAHQQYPLAARRQGLEGVVEVELELGEKGEVLRKTLKSTENKPLLEQAAFRAIDEASPFLPPPQGFLARIIVPIKFELK